MNIFEFSDYKFYLKQWLRQAKKARTCNLSQLAEVAKIHPTFLSHVLTGDKDLSLEQAAFVSEYIGNTALEREYFFTLIHLARAGTVLLRKYWLEKKKQVLESKNNVSRRLDKYSELTDEQRLIFYSSWIYVAAWIATAIDDGQTLSQITHLLNLDRDHAESVLMFLVQNGLCKESDGIFTMGKVHIHVPNESPFVAKHHMNWRIKAMQKMDFRENSELFYTAPMSIAKKDFDVLREKLMVMIKDTIDVARESNAEELVCLSIDFFRPAK